MRILDQDFKLKYGLRAMFMFEQITERPFKIETMLDEYILLYSCLISVKDNPSLDFNEFIDYCDEHPELLTEFNEYMQKEASERELLGKKKVKIQEKN